MKNRWYVKILGIGSLLFLIGIGTAQGQNPGVAIGNDTPVLDKLGRPLPGDLNGDSNLACRVEIREWGTGIAAPDPVTGEGNDAANPLFVVTRIGQLVIGTNTGKFSYSLPDRTSLVGSYFARVYDAAMPADANYYANSLPFQDVPPDEQPSTSTLNVVFQGLSLVNQGDDSDSDGDGLPDWMELEMTSTDPNAWDSDEDGYYDGFEVIHDDYLENGVTNVNEIQFYLPDFSEPPSETNEYYVRWWSIPGVDYRLEYREAMVDGQSFSNIWEGTPGTTNQEVGVDWVWTNADVRGFFRYLIPE